MTPKIVLEFTPDDVVAAVKRMDEMLMRYFNMRFSLVGGLGSETELDRFRLAREVVAEALGITDLAGVVR